jgi:RNA polymerase sigma-70 factor, ECF subfamily
MTGSWPCRHLQFRIATHRNVCLIGGRTSADTATAGVVYSLCPISPSRVQSYLPKVKHLQLTFLFQIARGNLDRWENTVNRDSAVICQLDGDLIKRAQAGDVEAFAAIFHAHKRRIFSLCCRMVKDPMEAEDLTQDTFLQAFRKLSTFRGDSAFATWLHRIGVNTVLMHFRRKSLHRVSLDEPYGHESGPSRREYGMKDNYLSGCIDRIALTRAITELPDGYRTVFLLHEVEGYEHREIAELLGCSIGNCKSQLHKAKLRIREWLMKSQGPLSTADQQPIEHEKISTSLNVGESKRLHDADPSSHAPIGIVAMPAEASV